MSVTEKWATVEIKDAELPIGFSMYRVDWNVIRGGVVLCIQQNLRSSTGNKLMSEENFEDSVCCKC